MHFPSFTPFLVCDFFRLLKVFFPFPFVRLIMVVLSLLCLHNCFVLVFFGFSLPPVRGGRLLSQVPPFLKNYTNVFPTRARATFHFPSVRSRCPRQVVVATFSSIVFFQVEVSRLPLPSFFYYRLPFFRSLPPLFFPFPPTLFFKYRCE